MPRFDPHPERRPVVVSGASSGIGEATALAFAAAGFPVVLGARRVERCEKTAEAIRASGGEAVAIELDVCDPESVAAFAVAADARVGGVEVVVSNAGDVQPVDALDATPEEFVGQLRVNLGGPQDMLHEFVPAMVERGRGDVVFVTSDVVVNPRPHMAGYVAAKSGLEALATAARMELEGSGVRVGVVRPGPCATEQGATWDPDAVERTIGSWTRWGLIRHNGYLRAGDVAAAVLAMVAAPKGTHITLLEVQPEAPRRPGGQR